MVLLSELCCILINHYAGDGLTMSGSLVLEQTVYSYAKCQLSSSSNICTFLGSELWLHNVLLLECSCQYLVYFAMYYHFRGKCKRMLSAFEYRSK